MYSVKYDNTELVNSTYHLQNVKDQSATSREFVMVPYASDNGSIIISDSYGVKTITVKGIISATSVSGLQTAVDTFKELFGRRDKNLDILPLGGSTRRYVANCIRHTLDGDFFNLTYLPYESEFIVASGYGFATSETLIFSSNFTSDYSDTITLSSGSLQEQKLNIRLQITTADSIAGIRVRTYYSDLFDTSIIVTKSGGFLNGDVLDIDCLNKTVKINDVAVNYYGTFPRAIIGTNLTNLDITFSEILIESTKGTSSTYAEVYDSLYKAQSFRVTNTDDTYRKIRMLITKTGTPPNDLIITIEGDNNGAPDGSAVATFTVAEADISGPTYIEKNNATNFTLNGNTTYWFVVKTTAGDSSNKYRISMFNTSTYNKGNYAISTDSGSSWTNDYTKALDFDLWFGGVDGGSFSVLGQINYTPIYL